MNSIGIEIDKLTPCLENRETGELIDTQYNKITVGEVIRIMAIEEEAAEKIYKRYFKD